MANNDTSQAAWDEDRRTLTPRTAAANNLSFDARCAFYAATQNALPWEDPGMDGGGDDPGRKIVAATWVENLFRKATVDHKGLTDGQRPFEFITRCLALEFINPALDLLIEHGLLLDEGDDGGIRLFKDKTELYLVTDRMVTELRDDDALQVTKASWDWTNEFVCRTARTRAHAPQRALVRARASKT